MTFKMIVVVYVAKKIWRPLLIYREIKNCSEIAVFAPGMWNDRQMSTDQRGVAQSIVPHMILLKLKQLFLLV